MAQFGKIVSTSLLANVHFAAGKIEAGPQVPVLMGRSRSIIVMATMCSIQTAGVISPSASLQGRFLRLC